MLRKWLKLNNTIELLNITTYKHKRNMKKYLLFTIIILCNLMVQAQKIDTISFLLMTLNCFWIMVTRESS